MGSVSVAVPPEVVAAFDALDAAVAMIGELNFDNYDIPVRLRALEWLETVRRNQVVASHDMIGGLAEDPADVGGPVHKVIADWLRISCAEARRRVRNAEQLSARVTLTGQTLPPELPATAKAWRAGLLDEQHLRVIQTFVRDLPQNHTGRHGRPRRAISCPTGRKAAPRSAGEGGQPVRGADQSRRQVFRRRPCPSAGFQLVWSAPCWDERGQADRLSGAARKPRCVVCAVCRTRDVQPRRSNPVRQWRTRRRCGRAWICVAMPSVNMTRSTRWFAASWVIRNSVCTTGCR